MQKMGREGRKKRENQRRMKISGGVVGDLVFIVHLWRAIGHFSGVGCFTQVGTALHSLHAWSI